MLSKLTVKLALSISVLVNCLLIVVAFVAHPGKSQPESRSALGPFSIVTSPGLPPASKKYLIGFEQGRFYWTVESDMLSLNVGLSQSVTLKISPTNDHIEAVTLELNPQSGQGFYVSDLNADGIPDKKQAKMGGALQIFYGGEFIDSFVEGGRRYILKDGRKQEVVFENWRWLPIQH